MKLLVIAELDDGEVSVRVHPAMVPESHPLASVRDAFNAVFVEGEKIGQLMFYGRGAGGDPTAVAVVGIWRRWRGTGSPAPAGSDEHACTSGASGRWTTRRSVLPQPPRGRGPGVLAEIADHFGRNGVSIERVWQEGSGDEATLVFITHRTQESAFQKTLQQLRDLRVVRAISASCAWRERSEHRRRGVRRLRSLSDQWRRPPVARRNRGVSGATPGLRRDTSDHLSRGRPPLVRSDHRRTRPAATCG